ncbi:NAD(P)-binding protein [Apiospora marii]|uniref:NAD(P)-binding protein n=1 Tax=Apiospora marii TaxID=335849 RepID=A0ABR1RRT3_9PEZI
MDTSKLFRVDGMVAAITGGGTGIGLVMARALLGAGAKKVYILGRRRDVLDKAASDAAADLKKTSSSSSGVLIPIECDVTSKASLQSAVDAVAKDAGYLNLLVANSGIGGPESRYGKGKTVAELRRELFEGVEMEDFTRAFHVNVTGAYFTMLAFLELLDAGNKHAVAHAHDAEGSVFGVPSPDATANPKVPAVQSQVVFTSSISAFSRSYVSGPAYSGSKSAIMHLTKHSSSNLAEHGIRVNALAPGCVRRSAFLPSLRFGTEHEMAGTILYLVSRAGAYCNGSIIVEDGGRLGVMPAAY